METCQSRKAKSVYLVIVTHRSAKILNFLLYLCGYQQRSKKLGLHKAVALQRLPLIRSFAVTGYLTAGKKEILKCYHYLTIIEKFSKILGST